MMRIVIIETTLVITITELLTVLLVITMIINWY